jgi:cyclophilin family peptidyl-prolyl cis-trans isomerase
MSTLRMYLEDTYGEEIRFAYRHFALSFHDKALITAEATEAAGAQGKFWEMHDLLYERQQEWGQLTGDAVQAKLVEYAEELGLDTERLSQELSDHIYLDKVNADTQVANQVGLPGTPTYVINGVIYPTQQWGLHPLRISAFIDLLRLKDRMYTEPPPQVIDLDKDYVATIRTEHGDIVIELYDDQVPVNVNSFVFLARDGWYDGVTFHRVIPGFVAQAGDPTGSGVGSPGYSCDDEIVSELMYDGPGVVGMASGGPGTSSIGSQFFITYDALPQLDGNYTIIGRVIEGMAVVESITPRDPSQGTILPPGDVIETIVIEER